MDIFQISDLCLTIGTHLKYNIKSWQTFALLNKTCYIVFNKYRQLTATKIPWKVICHIEKFKDPNFGFFKCSGCKKYKACQGMGIEICDQCETCEKNICIDCWDQCANCSTINHTKCMDTCHLCKETFCSLSSCIICEKKTCEECQYIVNSNEEICDKCYYNPLEDEIDDSCEVVIHNRHITFNCDACELDNIDTIFYKHSDEKNYAHHKVQIFALNHKKTHNHYINYTKFRQLFT
jgi:hypothetical protein